MLIDVYESDALLKTARVADAAEVARRGLASARQAGLAAFWTTAILAGNGAEALLAPGPDRGRRRPHRAAHRRARGPGHLARARAPGRDRPAPRGRGGGRRAAGADRGDRRPGRERRLVPRGRRCAPRSCGCGTDAPERVLPEIRPVLAGLKSPARRSSAVRC